MARFIARDRWKGGRGRAVAHERRFDPVSGRLEIHTTLTRGTVAVERAHAIRLYTATRLVELAADVGFRLVDAWDGWASRPLRRTSPEMLLRFTKAR